MLLRLYAVRFDEIHYRLQVKTWKCKLEDKKQKSKIENEDKGLEH